MNYPSNPVSAAAHSLTSASVPSLRRLAGPAIGIILLQRALLVAMAFWHGSHHLFRWDANWYQVVATYGYVWPPQPGAHGHPGRPTMAFFPFLPVGAQWLHRLTGLGLDTSLETLALIGLPFAAWGIAAAGSVMRNRRTGLLLVALWGAAPRALVTILPYTEALFTAMAAWCLYAILRRHWWRAALLCAVAGLTRSSAATLVLTLGVAWLWQNVRALHHARRWGEGLLLCLTACSGILTYVAYVAHRTGHWDGYVRVQAAWGMQMGSPVKVLHQVPRMWHGQGEWVVFGYVVIVAFAAVALMLATVVLHPPLPVSLYTVISTLWAWAAQNYFWAKPRFLLPAFPLGLAPAVLLAGAPRWVAVLVVFLLTWSGCLVDVQLWAGHNSP